MKNINKNKNTTKLPMPGKVKKGACLYPRLLDDGLCRRRPDHRCKQFE